MYVLLHVLGVSNLKFSTNKHEVKSLRTAILDTGTSLKVFDESKKYYIKKNNWAEVHRDRKDGEKDYGPENLSLIQDIHSEMRWEEGPSRKGWQTLVKGLDD